MPIPPAKKRKKMQNEENKLLEKASILLNTPSDEYTTFGEYVAAELREIRSDIKRRKLKRIIQSAIIAMSEEDDVEYTYTSSASTPLSALSPIDVNL